VTDLTWIDAALTSARPQALGALLRYFRDLDRAEEALASGKTLTAGGIKIALRRPAYLRFAVPIAGVLA